MAKKIKSVKINDNCIGCGSCASIAPDLFTVDEKSKISGNWSLPENQELIEEAADICPVGAIEVEYEE